MPIDKLFKNYELPQDEWALELLERVANLWEDNASTRDGRAPIYHKRVTHKQKEALITLSTNNPHLLQEMLDDELSLHNLLEQL